MSQRITATAAWMTKLQSGAGVASRAQTGQPDFAAVLAAGASTGAPPACAAMSMKPVGTFDDAGQEALPAQDVPPEHLENSVPVATTAKTVDHGPVAGAAAEVAVKAVPVSFGQALGHGADAARKVVRHDGVTKVKEDGAILPGMPVLAPVAIEPPVSVVVSEPLTAAPAVEKAVDAMTGAMATATPDQAAGVGARVSDLAIEVAGIQASSVSTQGLSVPVKPVSVTDSGVTAAVLQRNRGTGSVDLSVDRTPSQRAIGLQQAVAMAGFSDEKTGVSATPEPPSLVATAEAAAVRTTAVSMVATTAGTAVEKTMTGFVATTEAAVAGKPAAVVAQTVAQTEGSRSVEPAVVAAAGSTAVAGRELPSAGPAMLKPASASASGIAVAKKPDVAAESPVVVEPSAASPVGVVAVASAPAEAGSAPVSAEEMQEGMVPVAAGSQVGGKVSRGIPHKGQESRTAGRTGSRAGEQTGSGSAAVVAVPAVPVSVPAEAAPVQHGAANGTTRVLPVQPVTVPVGPAVATVAPAVQGSVALYAEAVAEPVAAPVAALETQTLAATPQVLEVGVASGTHGWLRVRAEMGHGGEVTASVIASSGRAAETLHRELPAMGEYLSREQVGVSSVAVQPFKGTVEGGGFTFDGAGADGGAAQGGRNGSGGAAQRGFAGQGEVGWAADGGSIPALSASAPGLQGSVQGSGGWVNVRV